MHSNYNYDYLKRQKPGVLFKLLIHVRDNEVEQRAWELWLVRYLASQFTAHDDLPPFGSYLDQIKNASQGSDITDDDYDEIIKKAEASKAKHQKTLKR